MNKLLIVTVMSSIMLLGCAKKYEPVEGEDAEELSTDSSESATSTSNDEVAVNSLEGTNEYGDSATDEYTPDSSETYVMAEVEQIRSPASSYQVNEPSESSYSTQNNSAPNGCTGSSTYYSCYDSRSGNTYDVSKYGNTTDVNGHNSNTGATWSQSSQTIGNSTFTTGSDKDGNLWNQTTNHYGDDSYSYNGTDSDGNSFSGSCSYGSCTKY
ncbi:hypothetical protein [Acinetobacter bereziniae]|uniref:hypothetical protein n=1 Tax=Acinetobacter bereziniae TaxID=106648 RepID=UPI001C07043E|nr:hypothetical protein [Acinetobacter bereziniae]